VIPSILYSARHDDPALIAFLEAHGAVVNVRPPVLADTEEQRRPWVMHSLYIDELVQAGLLLLEFMQFVNVTVPPDIRRDLFT
jgi:hypothetical protein